MVSRIKTRQFVCGAPAQAHGNQKDFMKTKPNLDNLNLLIAISAVCSLLVGLQDVSGEEKDRQGQLSAGDYKFVTETALGGRMEVELGRLAAQKGSDAAVRDFGERMVRDHQKANQELTQLVMQKGAALPAASSKKEDEKIEHFKALSGADFDKAYIKDMVSDHRTDIKEFQKEADKANDADLKVWVVKTLPILQEHLKMAQNVEAVVAPTK
jgi:putative membrane protein